MILVTGGAGYIGSQTVLALAEAGYEPLVIDNLSLGQSRFVLAGKLIELDIRDRDGLARVLSDHPVEGIIHFAGLSQVGESVTSPRAYYENNLVGGLNLLGLAAESYIPVVFSSSAAVYGRPERLPLKEDHPKAPINPYGLSKHVLEEALADYHRAFGLDSITLRYFNAAGADPGGRLGEAHDPETHLIPIALDVALGKRDHLPVFGTNHPTPDGTCVRDYVHVSDLAQAHLLALRYLIDNPGALVLNLGLGRGYSVREVVRVCRKVTGRDIPVAEAPPRPGDPPELVADPSLAREVLGWRPKFTELADIVATAWSWHSSEEV